MVRRIAPSLAILLIASAGCGGGPDGVPAAPPTAPVPTPKSTLAPAPEPEPRPVPSIEITPVGRGISVTDENQILLELMPEDIVPANPLGLAGRTVIFTPDGSGGYSRDVRALAWEEDIGAPVDDNAEIELSFPFEFSAREWRSFFVSRYGLITFGEPYPFPRTGPDRFGTMSAIATHFPSLNAISALYKPHLGGWDPQVGNTQHISCKPDRVVLTWITDDEPFRVFGRPPEEKTRFQIVLYADGRIAFHYATTPADPEEAIRDGVVGLFPAVAKAGEILRIPDATETAIPAHLDLVETAFYRTTYPGLVMVELTTRSPIHPRPNLEFRYFVLLDTDQPWWRDRDRQRADEDLHWSVTVDPDGNTTVRGLGAAGAQRSGSRVSFLVHQRDLGFTVASAVALAAERNVATGAWASSRNITDPSLIEFPVAPDPTVDLSRPAAGGAAAQYEVFRYPMIRDRAEGVAHVSCRIIEVLGDAFDFMAFNSQFRVDVQETGPAHGFAGYYWGNIRAEVEGVGIWESNNTTPCESRLKNTWGFPLWMKASRVAHHNFVGSPGQTPHDPALTYFAHEIGHTWLAYAHYLKNGERRALKGDSGHWRRGLHAHAPFALRGAENGSVMGGNYWRENSDGTFTPTSGWSTRGGGFSWLDLYLMGLATPDEVPDMFVLHDLRETGGGWHGPHTAEKEIVTIEQVLAAMGPRNPPAERSRKVFNTGFVYFLLPGQEPDPELMREHASYRDRALEHWRHVTGGRGQLTAELPGR